MAIFKCDFRSKVLGGNACFNVIIPEQCLSDIPTVLLLHGLAGNHNDWLRFSAIERYAIERDLAVVMPAADMSFYADMLHGRKYYSYIIDELASYTRRIFPLSTKREKNFVAGLSMGGYGALKIALKNSENFAACASFSGAVDIGARMEFDERLSVFSAIWGKNYKDELQNGNIDLFQLVQNLEDSQKPKPWIFQACGTDDSLYQDNLKFKAFIENKGYTYEYREAPGAHTWDMWDFWLPNALDFFKRYLRENNVEEFVDRQASFPFVIK